MPIPASSNFTLSDLLCTEGSAGAFSCEPQQCSSDLESPACSEESIAASIENERNFVPSFDYSIRFQARSLDASAREASVAWILEVRAHFGFQPLTAYLAVNYLDRLLDSRRMPETSGWPLQLLSVACISLAAKMEEPVVPSLMDLQVRGAKFIFETRTIQRTELFILDALGWRLRSVTPFSFIAFFASKLDAAGTYIGILTARSTEIILSNIKEASFLEFWPSCVAAAAMVSAASEIGSLSLVNPEDAELWCDGLCKEKIIDCYLLMQRTVGGNKGMTKLRSLNVLQQFRVATGTRIKGGDGSSSSSSSSSLSLKRRKLDDCLWVEDGEEENQL